MCIYIYTHIYIYIIMVNAIYYNGLLNRSTRVCRARRRASTPWRRVARMALPSRRLIPTVPPATGRRGETRRLRRTRAMCIRECATSRTTAASTRRRQSLWRTTRQRDEGCAAASVGGWLLLRTLRVDRVLERLYVEFKSGEVQYLLFQRVFARYLPPPRFLNRRMRSLPLARRATATSAAAIASGFPFASSCIASERKPTNFW